MFENRTHKNICFPGSCSAKQRYNLIILYRNDSIPFPRGVQIRTAKNVSRVKRKPGDGT